MSIRLASGRDEGAWDRFVAASPHGSFLQSWKWGNVQQAVGSKYWRLILEEDGQIISTALIVRRDLPLGRSWLYVPRGPIFSQPEEGHDYLAHWQKYMADLSAQQGALFFRIDPALTRMHLPHGWQKAEREVQPRHTLLVDLTLSEEDLLKRLRPKIRYNIRLAQRKQVQVRFSTDSRDLESFLELSRTVTARSSFRYHPDTYYRAILSELGPSGMAEIAVAEHGGDVLAAHLMIYFGQVATYAHGASSSLKREYMAPTKLYWETILRAKQKGCASYDFFGVAPPDAGADHPWSGVSRLKLGFGGERQDYIGAYDFIFDQNLYQLFNIARRAKSFFR